jgi:hypothetical protein
MRMAKGLMASLGRLAAPEDPKTPGYLSRWDTTRFDDFAVANRVPAFVIETPYALSRGILLTREKYRETGRLMAARAAAFAAGL